MRKELKKMNNNRNKNKRRKMTKKEIIRTVIAGIAFYGSIAFFWACFFHAYGN